jgi:hypothetical protein
MPPPEIQSAVPETEKEKELAQGVGDLFKRLRQGKASADTLAPAEAVAMPASSAAAVEAKAPDETQEEDPWLDIDENSEFDLNDPEGCSKYIVASFPKPERSLVKEVAKFYVFSELRKQTSKTKPLWQVFHSAVIGPKKLTSKSGRKTWLQAWSANRSKRYAKPPKA